MIERLQGGAGDTVRVTKDNRKRAKLTVDQAAQAGQFLEQINGAVTRIRDMNTRIASAEEQKSMVALQIERNIETLNPISESSSRGADTTAQVSSRLSEMPRRLHDMVGQFRT